MPLSAEYWFLFPTTIAISTVAMASGIRVKLGIAVLFIGVCVFMLFTVL